MARSILSIDIGTSAIKGVKVINRRQRLELVSFSGVSLPKGMVEYGRIQDQAALADSLTELYKELKPGNNDVVVGISGILAVIRTLKLPRMEHKEIRETLPWEMEQYLSFPVQDAIFDFVVTRKDEEEQQVLAIAVPKDIIQVYWDLLKQTGFKVCRIDLQLFALYFAYTAGNHPAESVALVDIGAGTTDVIIVSKEAIELNRTLRMGGDDFSQVLADSMDVSFPEGERFKLTQLNEDSEIPDDLAISFGDLSGEISRSLVHFQINHRGQRIDRVLFSGGGSLTGGLMDYLKENLDVNINFLDVLPRFEMPPYLEQQLRERRHQFVVSLGMVLGEVIS